MVPRRAPRGLLPFLFQLLGMHVFLGLRLHVWLDISFEDQHSTHWGFLVDASDKKPTYNAGDARDAGSIPGLERYLGEENGNPLQDSCLGNLTDKGTWWAAAPGVAKERRLTTKQQHN